MKSQYILMGLAFALIACQDKKSAETSAAQSTTPDSVLVAPISQTAPAEGKSVFEAKCASCHTAQDPSPVGPSIAEIKSLPAYQNNPAAIAAWAKSPATTPKRKMAMPPVQATDTELQAAAQYLLSTQP